MDQQESKVTAFDRALSWASFALLSATAAAFAWYTPRYRAALRQIFADFKLELPRETAIACAIPAAAIVALSVVAAASALVVQIAARSKRSAALFHLLLTCTLGVLFLVYREAMGNALMKLIEGVSGGPDGR